ncbi:hypothetical protein [Hymenobacter psychrophilus]|uniref:Uncharacterized protein n=1 Tax=Hymenobacter psychrophilus TaxID=651662 RepID=A0A1H3BCX7_9BACT|nr:hypothetical protein [Hymenobacter psychrophilus]SDX39787.1 hypothetical protein SAMN04488069_101247 [Hymenobacter psychrophilus]
MSDSKKTTDQNDDKVYSTKTGSTATSLTGAEKVMTTAADGETDASAPISDQVDEKEIRKATQDNDQKSK